MRWLKKGIPAVYNFGEEAPPLTTEPVIDDEEKTEGSPDNPFNEEPGEEANVTSVRKKTIPPKQDEFIWQWKVCNASATFVSFN